MAALLDVQALRTEFATPDGSVRAVDSVTLQIERGGSLVLLGESGSGKSVTALSIMRLLPPAARVTDGLVRFDGNDLRALPERQMRRVRGNRIAMIFQEPMTSLNPVMTVGAQIAEAIRQHQGLGRTATRRRGVELLAEMGIPDAASRYDAYPHQLSGGMKQRVMIAMALACDPELLIADEPTTALDVTTQAQILELLRRQQRERDMALLLVTHDLGVAAQMADRIAVMRRGRIVEENAAGAFFANPRHPYSRALFDALPSASKRGHYLSDPAAPPPAPAATLDQPLVEVRDLRVHFAQKGGLLSRRPPPLKAVDGVSFHLERGRTLAIVGESGCGKTTLARAIMRLGPISAGQVLFEGEDMARLRGRELRRFRRRLQMVFQDPYGSLNPRMRIAAVVKEGMKAQGIGASERERDRRVGELLEQVGLPANAAERYPHEFSGGQRQRISLARALAVEPDLLICDEPTSALDVSVQAQILDLLRRLQAELGLANLFVTHNLAVVEYLADTVAVMYLGRVVEWGPVEQVLTAPAHPYTRALLAAVPRVPQADVAAPAAPQRAAAGDPPSPLAPPPGCHFHPRCPLADARCRSESPPAVPSDGTHWAACWKADFTPPGAGARGR